MRKESFLERNISQNPALELFEKLGFIYISPNDCISQRKGFYGCILQDILKSQLRKINQYEYDGKIHNFSNYNIDKAVADIDVPIQEGLIVASEKIHNLLVMGKSFEEQLDNRKASFDLNYIDWDNPDNNVFHVTDEFSVESHSGGKNCRVDLVLFVNGIPFAVIECKSADKSVEDAVEQNIRNQTDSYIPQLYKYVSLVVATNKNKVKYGTTKTTKKFFSTWKYENDEKDFIEKKVANLNLGRLPTTQDLIFTAMMSKERLLEIARYFIVFDANVKKVCRYQQYYAIKDIIRTINKFDSNGIRQGGVVWHTQGSGKSLTMVMISNYILSKINPGQSKVVIVTDRKELDKQIARTFSNSKIRPARAISGKNLVQLIKESRADVITTIINKFSTADKCKTKVTDRDVFILVDESHRSNYGELAIRMRRVFPNACYIGFTGTPLMKNDKTAVKFGGNYIHKYTIKNGVEDQVIVPLVYESRFVEQNVDEANIDLWFSKTSEKLTPEQKEDLKRKWSSIKKLNSSNARIERIALDIDEHFSKNIKETGFKAMLATNSKLDAVRYYNSFNTFSDLTVAVCISPPDEREGYEDDDESNLPEVQKFWKKMMAEYSTPDDYEDSIKNKFCDGDIDILIVCSKLLTGFDAPICQVLYIDKQLKEHGLLQAIARTNRIYEGKDYGLIIDYRGLISELDEAMDIYSGEGGLDKFEKSDLECLVSSPQTAVAELRESSSNLENFFSSISNKNDEEEYEVFLEKDKNTRDEFCDYLCDFGKKLSLVLSLEQAYSLIMDSNPKEIDMYKDNFKKYSLLRVMIKKRCGEILDNKEYEKQMQNLLDKHMSVKDLNVLTKPINIMDKDELEKEIASLGSKAAKADAIRHNLGKTISLNTAQNPAYYQKFSQRIENTLQQYKMKVISDVDYLQAMKKILNDFREGKSGLHYPSNIKGNVHAEAFYGVLLPFINENQQDCCDTELIGEIALQITEIVKNHTKVDWKNNQSVHNEIEMAIYDLLFDLEQAGKLNLSKEKEDQIIQELNTVAIKRF